MIRILPANNHSEYFPYTVYSHSKYFIPYQYSPLQVFFFRVFPSLKFFSLQSISPLKIVSIKIFFLMSISRIFSAEIFRSDYLPCRMPFPQSDFPARLCLPLRSLSHLTYVSLHNLFSCNVFPPWNTIPLHNHVTYPPVFLLPNIYPQWIISLVEYFPLRKKSSQLEQEY